MDKLKEDLKILRALCEKKDDACITRAKTADKMGQNVVKQINIAKHHVYEKMVSDLDDILEEYFSI